MTGSWSGASYSSIAALQRTLAMRSLDSIEFAGDEFVIDLGCGDGAITEELAGRVPQGHVVGIDPEPAQIDFARVNHKRSNLKFEYGDATTLSTEPCDLLVSFNALHWVHDLEAAVGRIFVALKPGGRIVFRFVGAGERQSWEQTIALTCEQPQWAGYFGGLQQPFEHRNKDQWSQLLTAAGFSDVAIEIDDEQWDFGSREGFYDWGTGTLGWWLAKLPTPMHRQFINDALDAYEALPNTPGVFRYIQFRVLATRP